MGEIKRRKTFTIQEKMQILAQVDSNTGTRASLAEKLGIRRSTLNGIVKNREDTERYYAQCGEKFSSKRKSTKQSPMEELEIMLSNWFKECKASHTPVTGKELKEKARQLAEEHGIDNFKASNGWIDRFKQRFNVVYKSIVPAPPSDSKIADDWKAESIAEITSDYNAKDVYNAVEIGLYYKLHPSLTHSVKGDPCNLGEKANERFTVLLVCNADGTDKLMPLVIGKEALSQDVKNLPTLYVQNNKAWITLKVFENFLKTWDSKLKLEHRKVLLFLDPSPVHSGDTNHLTNIKVIFFPANCTSQIHPFDQRITCSFKYDYRMLLIRKSAATCKQFIPKLSLSLLDALNYVADAWQFIDCCTIKSAFDHCGFKFDSFILTHLKKPKRELYGISDEDWQRVKPEDVSFLEYVSCDDYLETCELESGEDVSTDVESDVGEDEEIMDSDVPTFQTAIEAVKHIRRYCVLWGNDANAFTKLNEVENELYKTNDLNSLSDFKDLEKNKDDWFV